MMGLASCKFPSSSSTILQNIQGLSRDEANKPDVHGEDLR